MHDNNIGHCTRAKYVSDTDKKLLNVVIYAIRLTMSSNIYITYKTTCVVVCTSNLSLLFTIVLYKSKVDAAAAGPAGGGSKLSARLVEENRR